LADQEEFYHLPAKEFECVRYEQVKADKYGYIRIENKLYSTSAVCQTNGFDQDII
jgi:hypothetical protein